MEHQRGQNFLQSSTNSFAEVSSNGMGGDVGNTIHTGGNGVYHIYNTSFSFVVLDYAGSIGKVPGGGGGGGYRMTSNGSSIAGYSGGKGLVVLHY